jgi:hypothetical protein
LPTKRKRTEIDYSDPYQLIDCPHFTGYAERLRQLGAFDGLDYEDARQVAGVIITDQMCVGGHGWVDGPRAPRDIRVALQQRAANIGAGCDAGTTAAPRRTRSGKPPPRSTSSAPSRA